MTCYCGDEYLPPDSNFQCKQCESVFHPACLKNGKPSNLEGDVLYDYICVNCSPTGDEQVTRMKLQWSHILQLTLYNLRLKGGGNCGFFQWKEQICNFVYSNWKTFFPHKSIPKQWQGTVAGTLSAGQASLFLSGASTLKEQGWWALKESRPPTRREIEANLAAKAGIKKKRKLIINQSSALQQSVVDNEVESLGECSERRCSRRSKKTKYIEAEIDKDTTIAHNDDLGLNLLGDSMDPIYADVHLDEDLINISPGSMSPLSLGPLSPSLEGILSQVCGGSGSSIDGDNTCEKADDTDEEQENERYPTPNETYSIISESKLGKPEVQEEQFSMVRISQYEERKLLQQLESYPKALEHNPEARRLRRKLLLLKTKRERNLPIFDLDQFVNSRIGRTDSMAFTSGFEMEGLRRTSNTGDGICVLDRFQICSSNILKTNQHGASSTFMAKLMGSEEPDCIFSPYTNKKLPYYIWKDYQVKPLKLRLLEEIQRRPQKNDSNWVPPESSPIYYCFVQPQHIPSVNTLCREFFWPGIDMSECLKYPDYSCIALYKKLVIGFAFLVPDVKYNEAYISFIFTHPEWRNAGIATVMLYHLIQTCGGKDITLHVSATNPALFLYQKFGFKIEEFILDFYDKYYPVDSKECKHALFIRHSW
ncbi:Cysteine-rich protein 2-binding protein [Chamberlinius hualienensis]